jgi:hypothetical protein
MIDSTAIDPAAIVYPAFVDKLRTVVQWKLGGDPFTAREYFAPYKLQARKGTLTVGKLLCDVHQAHGPIAVLTVSRALAWLDSEDEIKREHRRACKGRT